MATSDYAEFYGEAADDVDRLRRQEKYQRERPVLQRLEQTVLETWAAMFAAGLVLEFHRKRLARARAASDHGIITNHQPFEMEWLRDIPKEIRDVDRFLELVNVHLEVSGMMFTLSEYRSGIYDAAAKDRRRQAKLDYFE